MIKLQFWDDAWTSINIINIFVSAGANGRDPLELRERFGATHSFRSHLRELPSLKLHSGEFVDGYHHSQVQWRFGYGAMINQDVHGSGEAIAIDPFQVVFHSKFAPENRPFESSNHQF